MSARTIDTGTDHLLASVEDRVATITLNRPERRNAFSSEMLSGLALALDDAERASDVGCVVITGAGGAFCAGGDVKGMNERNAGGGEGPGIDARIHAQRLSQRATSGRIYTMPKPVIAALPGAAAGAGFAVALACDLRVAADNAVLVTSFARVGFSGDYGGTFFLTQLVGASKARELYYLSDRVTADEALRLGLVNRVVPASELAKATRELALRLAQGPTVAYRYMKENINRAASGADVMDCLDLEATHHVHTGLTEDHREAAKAFVEKREPSFKGR
ncbi:MAG: enoyl-CoA hydratase/isomerase family protein [Deltaproteobacteria bacterium]|nr:enoyl-CoA hydratase/isomerase family protein [Deltaproteobacteria bacterium]